MRARARTSRDDVTGGDFKILTALAVQLEVMVLQPPRCLLSVR